jgi:hypothetical protein
VLTTANEVHLRAFAFSNLELVRLFNTILKDRAKYRQGLRKHGRELYNLFVCNDLSDLAWRFATAVGTDVATDILPDAARVALSAFQALTGSGIASNAAADRVLGALTLLSAYRQTGKIDDPKISPEIKTDFYNTYASGLLAAKATDIRLPPSIAPLGIDQAVSEKLVASLRADPVNWITYSLLAHALELRGDAELAARAAATAVDAARSSYAKVPADVGKLTEEWKYHQEKAIAAASSLPEKQELLRKQLSGGVSNAPKLDQQGLRRAFGGRSGPGSIEIGEFRMREGRI